MTDRPKCGLLDQPFQQCFGQGAEGELPHAAESPVEQRASCDGYRTKTGPSYSPNAQVLERRRSTIGY